MLYRVQIGNMIVKGIEMLKQEVFVDIELEGDGGHHTTLRHVTIYTLSPTPQLLRRCLITSENALNWHSMVLTTKYITVG